MTRNRRRERERERETFMTRIKTPGAHGRARRHLECLLVRRLPHVRPTEVVPVAHLDVRARLHGRPGLYQQLLVVLRCQRVAAREEHALSDNGQNRGERCAARPGAQWCDTVRGGRGEGVPVQRFIRGAGFRRRPPALGGSGRERRGRRGGALVGRDVDARALQVLDIPVVVRVPLPVPLRARGPREPRKGVAREKMLHGHHPAVARALVRRLGAVDGRRGGHEARACACASGRR